MGETEKSDQCSDEVLMLRSIWRVADNLARKSIVAFDDEPQRISQHLDDCKELVDEMSVILRMRDRIGELERDLEGFTHGSL